MILELRKFEKFPVHIELVDTTSKTDVKMDSVVSIDKTLLGLDIQRSDEEYFCQGQLEADATIECARCLKPFKQKLVNSTDFIATPFNDDGSITDDEDRVYYDANLRAELWEIVRQTIILALSLKPLCREDCLGLCSQCGMNLNDKECKCTVKHIDPRLEPLKKLLSANNRKG